VSLLAQSSEGRFSVRVGLRQRRFITDTRWSEGVYGQLDYELPLSGSGIALPNGYRSHLSLRHFARVSGLVFRGRFQKMAILKPLYYYSNPRTDWLQVRAVAMGSLLFGQNPAHLDPIISGNGVDFNTVAEATVETLIPSSLAARQSAGVFLGIEKAISISSEVPYQPVPFVRLNRMYVWNSTVLTNGDTPTPTGQQAITEIGAGIRNLFVYYVGFYPDALKSVQSGGLKFTLRFFN
jgi:hypothetical protein